VSRRLANASRSFDVNTSEAVEGRKSHASGQILVGLAALTPRNLGVVVPCLLFVLEWFVGDPIRGNTAPVANAAMTMPKVPLTRVPRLVTMVMLATRIKASNTADSTVNRTPSKLGVVGQPAHFDRVTSREVAL
jgi:hypothetical protein